jgi:hypothetical protein
MKTFKTLEVYNAHFHQIRLDYARLAHQTTTHLLAQSISACQIVLAQVRLLYQINVLQPVQPAVQKWIRLFIFGLTHQSRTYIPTFVIY